MMKAEAQTERSEVLVDSERLYALTSDSQGALYLEVLRGAMAMENLVLPLSSEEKAQYRERGKPALDDLARQVLKNRSGFAERLLDE